MSFTCNDCQKEVKTVADVRNCSRCQSSGRSSSSILHGKSDGDFLTPMVVGMLIASSFSSHASPHSEPPTPAPSYSPDPAPSYEPSPSYDSGSSGGGFDSGSGGGGGFDTSGF